MTAPLPTSGAGTVPYVANWSSEDWAEIRHDPLVGRLAVFTSGARGTGQPRLGQLNDVRQRECMMRELCQVCRAPLRGRQKFSLGKTERRFGSPQGPPLPSVVEPFTCRRCAVLALTHCPGVRRERQACTLELFDVLTWKPILQMVDPSGHLRGLAGALKDDYVERIEALGAEARAAGGVVGNVKALLVNARPVAPEALLP